MNDRQMEKAVCVGLFCFPGRYGCMAQFRLSGIVCKTFEIQLDRAVPGPGRKAVLSQCDCGRMLEALGILHGKQGRSQAELLASGVSQGEFGSATVRSRRGPFRKTAVMKAVP